MKSGKPNCVWNTFVNLNWVSRHSVQFSSVVSRVRHFLTPWTAAQASLSITNSQSYSNSCPLSWWCHPTISSSFVSISSCFQSFLASGSFPRSQFFAWGGQSIGVSAATSVLPMNIKDWFPLGWAGWISFCPRESQESSLTSQDIELFWNVIVFNVCLPKARKRKWRRE